MKASKDLVVSDNVYLYIDSIFGPGGFTKVKSIDAGLMTFEDHPGLTMTVGSPYISSKSGEVAGTMDRDSMGWTDEQVALQKETLALLDFIRGTQFQDFNIEKLREIKAAIQEY